MKTQVRKKYIAIRKGISGKAEKSALIAERLFELDAYKNARTIAVYKSMASEVCTNGIISRALAEGKTVALPKTAGSEMNFYAISADESFEKSPFGVLEPVGDAEKYVPPAALDLIIVPGVAFDRDKNRLGFGKGCYDRFLAGTKARTISLCFSEQIVEKGEIPTDEFDIKMQSIITEKGII